MFVVTFSRQLMTDFFETFDWLGCSTLRGNGNSVFNGKLLFLSWEWWKKFGRIVFSKKKKRKEYTLFLIEELYPGEVIVANRLFLPPVFLLAVRLI